MVVLIGFKMSNHHFYGVTHSVRFYLPTSYCLAFYIKTCV